MGSIFYKKKEIIAKAVLGVEITNGITEVKKAADYLTKPNNGNRLAYAIRKFVL